MTGGRARERQPNRERAAAAGRALERDLATEKPGKPAADGEAKARAPPLARLETGELAEDLLVLVLRDARAGVRDVHADPAAGRRCAFFALGHPHPDPSALGRVLDRVRDEVAEDLTDPVRIGFYHRERAGQIRVEGEPLRLRGTAVLLGHVVRDLPHVRRAAVEFDPAGLRPREVDEVVDEPKRRTDRTPNEADVLALARAEPVAHALLEERETPVRRPERVLDVVREAAREARLGLEHPLELLPPRLGLREELDLVEGERGEVGVGARPGDLVRPERRPVRLP